ncbi:tRNA(Ile)-lysidine synthase [Kroppenstedtia guangzhouensis]|uniref:tRNA(Ile)-lysidine synthase n=1 Tax=Kroppenstedtia guangzhouensis TaxID=1274356 RepID=A0ABQ1GXZ0_9BACL|nr:tRNA lysidine(34) synthetase TilS [Kroppenstedtia guangzhouensis]GGA52164.1 tRNA(Ile)-lysidine synthase [Kroppenstedtia guangzhouensis]
MLEQMKKTIQSHHMLPEGSSVLVGVSGGPDSIALLHALCRIASSHRWKVAAVHVNHGLRGENSQADEKYVRTCCDRWEIPCEVEQVEVKKVIAQKGGNKQALARSLRYAAFLRAAQRIGAECLALAHQADDQVETLLMRLIRGTGPAGLAGIPATREWRGLRIVRPLLEVWRSDVEAYCTRYGLNPRLDESNRDPSFTRSRIRHHLLPGLESYNSRVKEALFQLAHLAADEEKYWKKITEKEALRVITDSGQQWVEVDIGILMELGVALQRRVIKLILNCLEEDDENETVTLDAVERIRRLAMSMDPSGETSLPGGVRAERIYQRLRILKAASASWDEGEKVLPVRLPIPGEVRCPAGRIRVWTDSHPPFPLTKERAVFDLDQLETAPVVRPRRPGDRVRPLGMNGTKKVKEALIDTKVPRRLRDGIPLLICGEEVIWVPGVVRSGYARVTDETRRFLCLEWQWANDAPDEGEP